MKRAKRFAAVALSAIVVCGLMPSTALGFGGQVLADNPEGTTIESIPADYRMSANYGEIEHNFGTLEFNQDGWIGVNEPSGWVGSNNGGLRKNLGTVDENSNGTVTLNDGGGTIETNKGFVVENGGKVERNAVKGNIIGTIETNNVRGTVETNDGWIMNSYGTVTTNNGDIDMSINGTVTLNNGSIELNTGAVSDNSGEIEYNSGEIERNAATGTVNNNGRIVKLNSGMVLRNFQYGTVEKNVLGATVHNYGGTVLDNQGTVVQHYRVTIEGGDHATISGLESIPDEGSWIAGKGELGATATVSRLDEGYEPTVSPSDAATLEKTPNGDYVLGNVVGNVTLSIRQVPDAPEAVVDIQAIEGVGVPTRGEVPVTTIVPTDQYTGTIVWSPTVSEGEAFAADQAYTATITLTPKAGYTFEGVSANFFTVAGATSVSQDANSGLITATFPRTAGAPEIAAPSDKESPSGKETPSAVKELPRSGDNGHGLPLAALIGATSLLVLVLAARKLRSARMR